MSATPHPSLIQDYLQNHLPTMAAGDDTKKNEGEKKSETEAKERRLLRVDQIYSRKDRQVHFVKTAKAGLSKANQERFNKTVLVVRRIISKQGMVARTEVDVKSTLLRDVLLDINKDVEGLELHKSPPMADPELLFHSLRGLESRRKQEIEKSFPDHIMIEHLSIAIQFVYEDFGKRIADLESLLPHKEITYDLLWTIFPPRTLVFTKKTLLEQPQVMTVRETEYVNSQDGVYFHLFCHSIAHDGEDFGTSRQRIRVPVFDGARKIEELPGFPLTFHSQEKAVRSELIDRGRTYVSLLDAKCQEYSGAAAMEVEKFGNNRIQKFNCTGRVMIDPVTFRLQNMTSDLIQYVAETNRDPKTISEDDLMMCTGTILGFSFSTKAWAAFAITPLKHVIWNEEAFKKLVIGPKQRTLVHTLVKAHGRGQSEDDDIIQDKGKGLVGLLSGSPGVGKTLTAEAVSEVTHRPLYMISAGELGKDLEDVDTRLDTVLAICRKWKCVLLLDEADVFLQARSLVDLERNALVSIFLRRLEYYQGILILTTNRVSTIDPAFQSRIHFSIQYPDLDTESRRIIWRNFVKSPEVTDAEVSQLAEWKLNGRQIKNTVACAKSIAWEERAELGKRHVDIVLEAIAEFSTAARDES
ncbi:MAG: hypothetical protein LQ352_005929 [Teloschistes flavicans]|nr:MAG: hypothetical protein LQ352_005929 [Teloschistes flavicans]